MNDSSKVGCVFPMVVVSILPHAEFGPNDHREDAPHFTNDDLNWGHRLLSSNEPKHELSDKMCSNAQSRTSKILQLGSSLVPKSHFCVYQCSSFVLQLPCTF